MGINAISNSLREELMSYLSNKPIWAFWITYSALTGVLFGIFYTALYLLGLQWWVTALVIIVIGMIWGSSVYSQRKPKKEKEDK